MQRLPIEIVSQLEAAVESVGPSRAEGTRRPGVKREHVRRRLDRPSNVALATPVRLCNAVSHRPSNELLPRPLLAVVAVGAARGATR